MGGGGAMAPAGAGCSEAELQRVTALLGSAASAASLCSTVDISAMGGPEAAAIRYIANSASGANTLGDTTRALDIVFVLFSGYLVFIMQAGFAMLCAGHIRVKNNANILLKNMLDCSMGTLTWYLVGNGFAFGEINGWANPFIGAGDFALSATKGDTTTNSSYSLWFFHWAFSAAATTIVAGAVAERISFACYWGYTAAMTAWVYPVVVHWFWTQWGWLSPWNARPLFGSGAIDFAGGAAVHTVGGTASLIAVWFLGPRIGRFGMDGEVNKDYRETNSNLVVLGTFLLWFGWYGFNPGSAMQVADAAGAAIVSRTAVTSTLAAGMGGVAAILAHFAFHRRWDVMQLCNGVLCGLVAVTPGCGVIDPWAALLVALLGAIAFVGVDCLMLRAQLDDVVAAVPMHLCCGALGMLFVGFFARQEYVEAFYGTSNAVGRRWGCFFGGDGTLLAAQVVSLLATMAWVALWLTPYFWLMRRFELIRVPMEQELAGLDASKYAVITTNELPTMPGPRQKFHV